MSKREKTLSALPESYNTRMLRDVFKRMAAVAQRDLGLLVIHPEQQIFSATPVARKLLGLKTRDGQLADLNAKLKLNVPDESAFDNVAVFFNARNVPVRLRRMPSVVGVIQFTVEDMSMALAQESMFVERGREMHGLFENATYGIYRSTFDGKPLRANPAMAKLNGYNSEAELMLSLQDIAKEWYVRPGRREEFIGQVMAYGKVVDFISEVQSLRTNQRMWVSETAWLIYGDDGKPEFIEGTVMDATDRVRQEQAMRAAAETDSLTGLSNRAHFRAQLDDWLVSTQNSSRAILLLDVDRFKDVNDVFGHERGDALLVEVAKRIQSTAPSAHLIARLGGDEFALLVSCDLAGHAALETANKIVEAIEKPITLNGTNHQVGASIGVGLFPTHGDNAEQVLRAADIAMYHAKEQGKGRAKIYHAELGVKKQQYIEIANDLRGADTRGELELFYQAIVESKNSSIVGYEALMRWRHPVRGLVPPNDFIPVAEEAGLMTAFGNWAINEACSHAAALPDTLRISVNVSATQFYSADLPRMVREALLRHKVPASRLELEVTESVVLRNEPVTLAILQDLKAQGVRIALDDFGTGHSSLSYLQRFAFDEVKIDRSFVRSLKTSPVNAAIVRAVLSIGRDLGMGVVAEGIENEADRHALVEEGCTLLQGYLYSRPKPFGDVVADQSVKLLDKVITAPANEERFTLSA
jgi:diguanylate cyclase (GGDEF)-like protein/PAS domain S-box-containing protein